MYTYANWSTHKLLDQKFLESYKFYKVNTFFTWRKNFEIVYNFGS